MPMPGIWEVATAPMMVAMGLPACGEQPRLEFLDREPCLLRADVLNVQAKYAGELGEVIDVAAGRDHRQHVTARHRAPLLIGQPETPAVGGLIPQESRAVCGIVERVTHLVERVALHGLLPVEYRGSPDGLLCCHTIPRLAVEHGMSPAVRGSWDSPMRGWPRSQGKCSHCSSKRSPGGSGKVAPGAQTRFN